MWISLMEIYELQILVPDMEGLNSEAECWGNKTLAQRREQSYQSTDAQRDMEAARESYFGSNRQQKHSSAELD